MKEMSSTFQVNQPTDQSFTIKIGVTIHNANGTITMEPQVMQQQQQQQQQQPRPQLRASSERSLDNLLRGFNSLSMNEEPVEAAVPHQLLSSIMDEQEPPAQLNQTRRRERAAQRPRAVGIPNVPDERDFDLRCARSACCQEELLVKAPIGARVTPAGGTAKLACGSPAWRADGDDPDGEIDREIMDELLDEPHRRRVPSSPYYPSGSSSHASSSPPASYSSAPTPPGAGAGSAMQSEVAAAPPVRRGRGRPRKPKPELVPGAPVAGGRSTKALLQPRPEPMWAKFDCGFVDGSDFVSTAEQAEAVRVIGRYADSELTTPNDRGELLCHTLAMEGNWAKLMALNMRLLGNASLGDIFTNINTANSFGQTALTEAVVQQNAKAVDYCCLFTSSSDSYLYRALVEAALLPSDQIFFAILRTMCHEMDENGNPVKRNNRFIDQPIGGWRFKNAELNDYAGLTLAQVLTLRPAAESHHRLTALIGCGANPRRPISADSSEYRAYIDCVHLAAAFSPAPYECLLALGLQMPMSDGTPIGWDWDTTGEVLRWCIDTIYRRTDLTSEYQQSVKKSLPQLPQLNDSMPELDLDDVISILYDCQCQQHPQHQHQQQLHLQQQQWVA